MLAKGRRRGGEGDEFCSDLYEWREENKSWIRASVFAIIIIVIITNVGLFAKVTGSDLLRASLSFSFSVSCVLVVACCHKRALTRTVSYFCVLLLLPVPVSTRLQRSSPALPRGSPEDGTCVVVIGRSGCRGEGDGEDVPGQLRQ